MVPAGTHDWSRFITPPELALMAADAGLELGQLAGMAMGPISGSWTLVDDTSVNYIAHLHRPLDTATSK